MRKYNVGNRVWIIMPWGILKGEVKAVNADSYDVLVIEFGGEKKQHNTYTVNQSRVYAWDDFGRACNLFEGLYL